MISRGLPSWLLALLLLTVIGLQIHLLRREPQPADSSTAPPSAQFCADPGNAGTVAESDAWVLAGTVMQADAKRSSAWLIARHCAGPSAYRLGDRLPDGSLIENINTDRVVVSLEGQRHEIRTAPPAAMPSLSRPAAAGTTTPPRVTRGLPRSAWERVGEVSEPEPAERSE